MSLDLVDFALLYEIKNDIEELLHSAMERYCGVINSLFFREMRED